MREVACGVQHQRNMTSKKHNTPKAIVGQCESTSVCMRYSGPNPRPQLMSQQSQTVMDITPCALPACKLIVCQSAAKHLSVPAQGRPTQPSEQGSGLDGEVVPVVRAGTSAGNQYVACVFKWSDSHHRPGSLIYR